MHTTKDVVLGGAVIGWLCGLLIYISMGPKHRRADDGAILLAGGPVATGLICFAGTRVTAPSSRRHRNRWLRRLHLKR